MSTKKKLIFSSIDNQLSRFEVKLVFSDGTHSVAHFTVRAYAYNFLSFARKFYGS